MGLFISRLFITKQDADQEPKIVSMPQQPVMKHRPTTLSSTFQYMLEVEELKERRGDH
jgi:hypothetical protein